MSAVERTSLWQRLQQWLVPARALPLKWQQGSVHQLPYVAIDLELNSLDINSAKVTSIGWVKSDIRGIDLASCYYQVTRAKGDLQQSPVIHGLIAEEIAQGGHIRDALGQLAQLAQSHIWVFHNANLDIGILARVFKACAIRLPTVVALDTLKLAVYQLSKQHDVLPPNSATLAICRQRLDLPLAPAHNALDDAMATLELLYAQLHQMDPAQKSTLGELMHTKAVKIHHNLSA